MVSYCDVAIEGFDHINEDVYKIIGVYATFEEAKYEAEMFIQDKLEYFVDGCRDKYEEAIEDGEIDEETFKFEVRITPFSS